jgi:glycosyltransferase involved in cell wall biosynthesis
MPKLTIAIPTYNGQDTICGTLDSVISQLEKGVEILVSDNASTDHTFEIIRKYQLKYPDIHYFRNSENLGADQNIDLVVRRSNGDYVWLLGDDDKIVLGGIKKVMGVLKKYDNLAAIYVNFGCYDRKNGRCITERYLQIEHDIYCKNSNNFLSIVTICPNFLSSNIVCRQLWLKSNNKHYIGTNWIQYGTLFSMLPGHSSYCIADPYIMNKSFNASKKEGNKNGVALSILLNLIDIIKGLPQDSYSKESINRTLKKVYFLLPRKISSSRRNGLSLSWNLLKRLINEFGLFPLFWVRDLPLLILPQFVHYFIWKFYKMIFMMKINLKKK